MQIRAIRGISYEKLPQAYHTIETLRNRHKYVHLVLLDPGDPWERRGKIAAELKYQQGFFWQMMGRLRTFFAVNHAVKLLSSIH